MKVITLTQPWATLVAIGAKRIETRSWKTDYRGPLAIHAAKGYPKDAARLCIEEPFLSALKKAGLMQYGVWHPSNNELPLGAIVATCELIGCGLITSAKTFVSVRPQPRYNCVGIPPEEPEFSFGDYAPGRYAWILANVKMLETPIPAKGALGLWNFDLEAAAV
jgi:hypothetical protein